MKQAMTRVIESHAHAFDTLVKGTVVDALTSNRLLQPCMTASIVFGDAALIVAAALRRALEQSPGLEALETIWRLDGQRHAQLIYNRLWTLHDDGKCSHVFGPCKGGCGWKKP